MFEKAKGGAKNLQLWVILLEVVAQASTETLHFRLACQQVDTQLLVKTQCGKKARKLTKHADMNIKAAVAELVNLWKEIVASEAAAVEKTKEQLGTLLPAAKVSQMMSIVCRRDLLL